MELSGLEGSEHGKDRMKAETQSYEAKKFKCVSEGHRAKRTETGKMRKTTGIIIEISALPALFIRIFL